MLAELLRALPIAIVLATVPGYFWARCLSPAGGLVELLAYSTALSMALVPTAAIVQTRILDSGVTLLIAVVAPVLVFASGAAVYIWLGRTGEESKAPLTDPLPPLTVYALVPLLAAFGLMLRVVLSPAPDLGYAIAVALLVLAAGSVGLLGSRRSTTGTQGSGEVAARPVWRAVSVALLLATMGLVLLRGYWGPVVHDWPFIRGGDQYSHAVMSGLMMTEGRIDSYLIYPPGFHTTTAIVSRLSGLDPLQVFPVLGPALLLLPPLACYALAARLWGREYGAAAAVFCGLLLVGPYESFAEARYPNILSADFLIVMAVAALIGIYGSFGARQGVLFAILGSSVVLYHQVGGFYLAMLLALVAILLLPYLLLAGHRREAIALFLSLALVGLLSVVYAWGTYDLGEVIAGVVGGSDTGAGGNAVAIAIGSQEPLSVDHLLETTSQPVVWLSLLGTIFATGEVVRSRARTPQALAYLTIVSWALILLAGSRTSLSGFPQRFERDLGLPLTVLAALAFVAVVRSVRGGEQDPSRATNLAAMVVATLAVAVVGLQAAQNLGEARKASTNVISEDVSLAGEWLGEHNTGGNIVVTPYLNDHVPGSAMLAMGGYTGLRSYTPERLRTPRALPPSGKEPLLAADWMMRHPTGARTESLLDRYDVRYVVLFKRSPGVPWLAFDRAPDTYEMVFENEAVAIFAPR